jgi:integrase
MEIIKVHVIAYPDRPNLMMRYRCPDSGKQIARSTGTKNRRDAERAAAKWEAELREGRYNKPSKMTWEEFREQFDRDVLGGLKEGTATTYDSTLNVFEREVRPGKLSELNTAKVTAFVTALRDRRLSPATIARHLRTLKVAARWANRQGLLLKVPQFDMPKQAKGMKGRPIVLEEFERMVAAAPEMEFYLKGLWLSGLRLAESLLLRWDDAPGALVVDFTGRRPMLRIPAESEKGGAHRLLAMAPEFAELLHTVPESQRRGFVFQPVSKGGEPMARTRHAIGPRFTAIGKAAGVIVGERQTLDSNGKATSVKSFASAHDLRRAFGFRWSRRVLPTILRELMRHESIETTLRYYVGLDAESTADELWRVVSEKLNPSSDNKRSNVPVGE